MRFLARSAQAALVRDQPGELLRQAERDRSTGTMMYDVSCGGERREKVEQEVLQATCAELVAKHGPESLKVVPHSNGGFVAGVPSPMSAIVDDVDDWGRTRAERDEKIAMENGFALPPPHYALGTRVNSLGVENARRSRVAWEQQPTVVDGCKAVVRRVQAEHRCDVQTTLGEVAMVDDGQLGLGQKRFVLADKAFAQLCNRIGCGGADYLATACWPALRAHNINAQLVASLDVVRAEHEKWRQQVQRVGMAKAGKAPEPKAIVLRTRDNPRVPGREAFAIVSEKYQGEFSIDRIATAVGSAVPGDARGTVDYDGERLKLNAIWHSDVQAKDYVAGEVFKAGVVIRADDTGSGGVSVSAVVWRNLCLNLIIIGRAEQKVVSLRHIGDAERMRLEFGQAFQQALAKVADFRKVWGFATHEDVVAAVHVNYPETQALTMQDLIPGIFSAVIEREKVPVRARRPDAAQLLTQKFFADEVDRQRGFTRAAVVNAFTRYAHEELADPYQQEELERTASGLLFPKPGRSTLDPIPWEPAT